jgi:hypothetical protein
MGTIISPTAHIHSQNPINKMINQLRFGGMRRPSPPGPSVTVTREAEGLISVM